jgi:hypothetical protein
VRDRYAGGGAGFGIIAVPVIVALALLARVIGPALVGGAVAWVVIIGLIILLKGADK